MQNLKKATLANTLFSYILYLLTNNNSTKKRALTDLCRPDSQNKAFELRENFRAFNKEQN